MARAAITIRIESDPVADAIELLITAREHLLARHGVHCRELERDIEAMFEADGQRFSAPPEHLDATTLIIPASDAVIALLRRARGLGLIP